MNSKKLIELLEKDGWYLYSIRGSHHNFKHKIKKGKITVPHPKKDLPIGTVMAILKQCNLKEKTI